jgi:hypothetical protein
MDLAPGCALRRSVIHRHLLVALGSRVGFWKKGKAMKATGTALILTGELIIAALGIAAPWVAYIGLRYGWLDARIEWVPLGMLASFLAVALVRFGDCLRGERE